VEQARIVRLLVECVEYDGDTCAVGFQFQPSGIQLLTELPHNAEADEELFV
jgi:hypothetical protein